MTGALQRRFRRMCAGCSVVNFAGVRHPALTRLRQGKTAIVGVKSKDETYLLVLLANAKDAIALVA